MAYWKISGYKESIKQEFSTYGPLLFCALGECADFHSTPSPMCLFSFRAVGKYFREDDEKDQPIPSTILILKFFILIFFPYKPIFNKLIHPMSIFI
jgi:hypothetical protein